MSYHFTVTLTCPFDEALEKATAALKAKGLGVLTTINVQNAMKEKLGEDINPYMILGACSPSHAFKAIQAEDKIGVMLPCNVLVQQKDDGKIEISIVDPVASMSAIHNDALGEVALEVQSLLKGVARDLEASA
ncbi:DUF302 domain-containing protein [Magnetovibrio blakemorei]|uniref:DUF302 domain-containing protein n=1 Tax=Magnetovibrio blakemorei TaxID=28181 RepID=A0A1E5Q5S7_9PROT|nr:DUF302 domain-containing protein [Magnetovibrio blakemorei]OEJ65956.1 hypothetical protein BEN30_13215 [Magnetovibrio blakemorei]